MNFIVHFRKFLQCGFVLISINTFPQTLDSILHNYFSVIGGRDLATCLGQSQTFAIPRYMLIDENGLVLEDDLVKPSSDNFRGVIKATLR